MIITKLLLIIATAITALVSWLPIVTTLPPIAGYDIDTALVNGVGQAYNFFEVMWVVKDVLLGALFLWGFYGLMLGVRLFLGHRAPPIN